LILNFDKILIFRLQKLKEQGAEIKEKEIERNLKLMTWHPDDSEDQFQINLRNIEEELKNQENPGVLKGCTKKLKLIIVDSFMDIFIHIPQCRGNFLDNKRSQLMESVF
jgi:hypothetical protein